MNEAVIITMSIVFLMFLIMVIIFYNIEKIMKAFRLTLLRKALAAIAPEPSETKAVKKKIIIEEASGEEYAAIAAAIYLYNNELHDDEHTILTIERATRTLAPWSVKYYSMNSYFMRRNR